MRSQFIPFLLLAFLCSCSKSENSTNPPEISDISQGVTSSAKEMNASADGSRIANQVAPPELTGSIERKIIKEGEISFESRDIRNTRKTIFDAAKKLGGYISEESESGYENNRKNYFIRVQVPARNFDTLIEAISSTASQIDTKNIRIQDITTEYIDTETRLKNKKALEQRYLELLRRASRMTDILAVENKLSEIRSEIESVEGQLRYMSKQVTYSTLSITFYSKSILNETGKGFFYELKNALFEGWDLLKSLFFGIITLWPLFLAIIAAVWAFKRWRKRS